MTSKQRAYLKGLAQTMEPIFQIGKNSLTPENTKIVLYKEGKDEKKKIELPR